MADGVGHINGHNRIPLQRDHLSKTPSGNQVDRGYSEACCQDAVKGRGRAATLNVPEHADSHFLARANADGIPNQIADRTCAAVLLQFGRQLHALSHYHDGEVLAGFFALGDVTADVFDGERDLRDEDDVSAAGDSGLESDPAAVAAHHLNHHHTMVRLCGGVNLVESVGDGVQRGVKSESNLGRGKIVIDGLGNADDLQSLLKKVVADLLRTVAADGDDGVDAQLGGIGDDLAGNVARHFLAVLDSLVMKRIAAVGGAEDGAAAGQNSAHFLEREFEGFFGTDQAVEAIGDADDLPSVLDDGSLGGGANDGVEAGRVPASGIDADAANV